jgi:Kae1-associated kinase Bud32
LVIFLDLKNYAIYMQRIMGQELRLIPNPLNYTARLGRAVGLMHKHDISHGDLTLSNILVDGSGGLWLVDFGLSMFNADLEEKAVDIHLLERSAANSFPNIVGDFMESFMEGYKEVVGEEFVSTKSSTRLVSRGRYVER